MTPKTKRAPFVRMLALALAAAACLLTPGGRAEQGPQGGRGAAGDKVSPELRAFVGRTRPGAVPVIVR